MFDSSNRFPKHRNVDVTWNRVNVENDDEENEDENEDFFRQIEFLMCAL